MICMYKFDWQVSPSLWVKTHTDHTDLRLNLQESFDLKCFNPFISGTMLLQNTMAWHVPLTAGRLSRRKTFPSAYRCLWSVSPTIPRCVALLQLKPVVWLCLPIVRFARIQVHDWFIDVALDAQLLTGYLYALIHIIGGCVFSLVMLQWLLCIKPWDCAMFVWYCLWCCTGVMIDELGACMY